MAASASGRTYRCCSPPRSPTPVCDELATELIRRVPERPGAGAAPEPGDDRAGGARRAPGVPSGGAPRLHGAPDREASFSVSGAGVERLLARYDLDNEEALAHLERRLRGIGVLRALEAEGFQAGDEVEIAGVAFDLDPESCNGPDAGVGAGGRMPGAPGSRDEEEIACGVCLSLCWRWERRCADPARPGAKVLRVGTFHGVAGQYRTIQAAVDAAKPGDWILIGPGDYKTTHDPRRPPGGRTSRPAS